MYWSLHDGKIVGCMMLAMGHVGKTQQAGLGIGAYGHLPALVIARLAADERHERNGAGRRMASFAISLATQMATDVGCRIVPANSEPDSVGFYKKMGFARFAPPSLLSSPCAPCPDPNARLDEEGDEGSTLVSMYVDMGQDLSIHYV